MEYKMASPTLGKYEQYALRNKPAFLFEEMQAATRNMSTGFVEALTSLESFQAQVRGTTSLFVGVGKTLKKFSEWTKGGTLGRVVGGVGGSALNIGSAYLMGQMLGAQMPRIYKQYANAMDKPVNDKVLSAYTTIGKSFGVLGAIYSVVSMINGAVQSYFSKQTEKKLDELSTREIAFKKAESGEDLTEKEKRIIGRIIGAQYGTKEGDVTIQEFLDKFFENSGKKTKQDSKKIDVNLKVESKGDGAINKQAAEEISKQIGREILEGAYGAT